METNRKNSPQIIEELVKQWKLMREFDDYDNKDLPCANRESFWQRVKDLSKDEYKNLADIIWPSK